MQALYSFSLVLLLLWPLTLVSQGTSSDYLDQLRVVTEELPPYQMSGKNGQIEGVAAEKVNRVLATLEITSNIEVMPWARAYKTAINEPGTLIFSIVRTPARENLFHWLGVLMSTKTYLISLRERTDIEVETLSDLLDYKVGVKRDDVVYQFLASKNMLDTIVVLPETFVTVKMLLRGRADIIAASPIHLDYMCEQIGCTRDDFNFLFELDELSNDFYLAANKLTPPDIILLLKQKLSELE
ncbi:polar amino acid transport system substrate-binding protein [Pseudoalteromonas rubra]|uniref:Polar amino acid transport system substrate-binding protein n=1 Tax=Pseudoalteromonas rubra TaxID=43658 RepID=A0A8T0C770_9GAMM|nr:transporter substrate-binding domain-containing protein [Pseudoalteromonas rubra]KAF7785835.1 polar amino acid transport system substrate-binding protein [Pseudoalteromonas rubra]